MGSNYYSPRPNFLNIGVDPQHKKEVDDSFKGMQNPIRRGCIRPLPPCPPPMGDKGFMVRNNARLAYTAVFDFEYDDQSRVHSEVSEGDKVFATFNNSTKGEFKVVTITAILKKIEPINDGKDFVLYLDASEENNSSVYKIGSRVLLDIGRILEDGETRKDLDPAETVEEITHPVEFPPYPPALPPCPPPPGPHPGYPCPPPPPGPKPYWPLPKKPEDLTWSDKSTEIVYAGDDLGYNILNITYSKKKTIQTMLIIYSLTGEVVYKAVDNSLKLSSLANFTWDFRNYSAALHDIPMLDKLENFTVDSSGRIVLTPYDEYSDKAKEYIAKVQKGDCFIQPGEYFIEIAAGPDIINYNPLAISEVNKNRIAISTKVNITAEAILGAAYYGPVVSPDQDAQNVINNLTDQDSTVTFKAGIVSAEQLVIDANITPIDIALCGNKKEVSAAKGDRATDEIGSDETVIQCPVKITGDHNVALSGLVFTGDAKIDLTDFTGNLTISNSKFVKPTEVATQAAAKKMAITIPSTVKGAVEIEGNYFGSSNLKYYNGLEINAKLDTLSSISGNYFDPNFCSHNAINIYDVQENAIIDVYNNIMESDNFLRIGIKGEPKCVISIENNTVKSAEPLDPVWNSPILVQPYGKQTTSFKNCTINIRDLRGLSDGAKPILAAASNDTDTDITDKLPTVNVDGNKYDIELVKF